jgi:predicted TPR repeat methyltransferase
MIYDNAIMIHDEETIDAGIDMSDHLCSRAQEDGLYDALMF